MSLRYYVWGAAVGWTCLVGLLIVVVILNEQNQIEDTARVVARTVFHRDRHWSTLYGEMYTPVTQETEKELLDSKVPLQFVTTDVGIRLAKLSPLLVRRALDNRADDPIPFRSRMTSLNPTHPENAPDPWETKALRAFETGSTELDEVQILDSVPHLRFIGALRTEQPCLRCHATQGYRLGEIRGGVSIAIPLDSIWAYAGRHTGISIFSLCVLWAVGLGGIQFGSRRLRQQIAERDRATEERLRNLIERRRAESALAESEERYRRIVDTTQEGIWEIDSDGRTTFVNRPMAEMLGYSVEGMMGRSMFDFMDDRARLEAESNLERRRQHVAEQHDFRFRRKDGSDLWTMMSTNPILDQAGGFIGALGMAMDITARKRSEEALQISEGLYRSLFNDSLAGVFRTTLDGRILAANIAVTRMLGYSSPEELIAQHAENLYFSEGDRAAFVEKLTREGVLQAHQKRMRRKDGRELWVLENVTLIGDVFHATMIDISEQRRTEEALRKSEDRLRLEQMRTQIASDLHDEIGSTLSSISVFNEMLKHELSGSPPRTRQLSARIEENLREAQDSLHEIVWTIDPENDSLENILLVLQSRAAELLEARGIRFEFMVPDAPIAEHLTMEKRRQTYLIFKEALNNLVKHSSCDQAFMGAYFIDGLFVLTLRDNGKGFDLNNSRSGNGLRNMGARAAGIGATLSVDSTEETGTTVTLRLPIT